MKASGNFVFKLLKKIFSPDTPEAIKHRKLKKIAKNISRSKFSKWYKPNSKELTVDFAKFIFTIYKALVPSQPLLASATSSQVLKNITIEQNLTDEQCNILSKISKESIMERYKTQDPQMLSNEISTNLKKFYRSFTNQQEEYIDSIYQTIEAFVNFVLFDFYVLLKKFDNNLPESNYKYMPNFRNNKSEYIIELLKEFAVLFYSFPFNADWNLVFSIIAKYKNIQAVNPSIWKKVLSIMIDVKRSDIILNLVKHIDGNPDFQIKLYDYSNRITDSYISMINSSAEEALKEISDQMKSKQIDSLLVSIFGSNMPVSGTKYYSDEFSQPFVNKGLDGFLYANALSYLKSFLIEYFKTEVRGLSDLFLVRAKWSSQPLIHAYSESYHDLLQIVDKILEFDDKLKQGEPFAMKLKASLARVDRDRGSGNYLMRQLNELNSYANKLIIVSIKHIITIGNNFKSIIQDYDKPRRTLIENWKEIEMNSDRDPREWLEEAYRKIHNFIKLMQLFVSSKKNKT